MNSYQTIASPTQFTYQEKRSEFLAFIYPVPNREAAHQHLNALKIQYSDARHHCWAYLIGNPLQPITEGFNDDGEPFGTAGKPILHVLTQRGAGNSCAIVVRYFGGIKLGAGGLVRAYSQAVSKALDCAIWQDVIPHSILTIEATYEDEPHIRHFVGIYAGEIIQQEYTSKVALKISIADNVIGDLKRDITQKTAGRTSISQ